MSQAYPSHEDQERQRLSSENAGRKRPLSGLGSRHSVRAAHRKGQGNLISALAFRSTHQATWRWCASAGVRRTQPRGEKDVEWPSICFRTAVREGRIADAAAAAPDHPAFDAAI